MVRLRVVYDVKRVPTKRHYTRCRRGRRGGNRIPACSGGSGSGSGYSLNESGGSGYPANTIAPGLAHVKIARLIQRDAERNAQGRENNRTSITVKNAASVSRDN